MLIDTVRETIRAHGLIHKGDHVVLGLSGGPDSVCLFHVLQRLAAELSLTIHPVHVNHRLRPGDAERDQAYAQALCAKAGLPCRVFTVDVGALAKELRQTSEEAGRNARYDAFVQVAREAAGNAAADLEAAGTIAGGPPEGGLNAAGAQAFGAGSAGVCIAVAQNANDQAETILHRILRGTGTDGLTGIAYKRYERGIPVIRPLLDVTREEIESYCEENGLEPVIDHTNLEPVYMRNRIRLELLPALAEYNENILETLTRLGRIAAADREYLWQQAEAAFARLQEGGSAGGSNTLAPGKTAKPAAEGGAGETGAIAPVVLDRAGLARLPEALRRRVVLRAFREIGLASDISEERLRAADAIIGKKQAPKTVEFPRGYRLTVAKGRVIFAAPA